MSSAVKRPSSVLDNGSPDPPERAKQQKKKDQDMTADEFFLSMLDMPDSEPAVAGLTEWRSIPTVPGYEASSIGRIRLEATKKILPYKSSSSNSNRYVTCAGIGRPVHMLVCLAFYGVPPSSIYTARHKNGIKKDNSKVNLEWVISSEEMKNATDTKIVDGRLRAVVQTRHTWKQTVVHRSVAKAAKVAHCSNGKMLKMCESGEFVGGSTWAFQDFDMS
jgi:hypothetical protein